MPLQDECWRRLLERWPTFSLERDQFERAVRAAVPAELEDFFLARAALAGEPAAVQEIVELVGSLRPALLRLLADPVLHDEVRQETLIHLLTGAQPRLAEYSGKGPLLAWLRAVCVRQGLNALKRRGRNLCDEPVEKLIDARFSLSPPPLDDAARVAEALRAALDGLGRRQRTLLRLHYLEGVSLERLAGMYRVHRATAARWLAEAREQVLSSTRARLAEALGLPQAELDALVLSLRSRLEVSFRQLGGNRA